MLMALVPVILCVPDGVSARSRKRCKRKGCRFSARLWKCVCKPRKPGAMIRIPGGCFMMGTLGGHRTERPVHRVCLTCFRIDMYEVTVNQYDRCITAGKCTKPRRHKSWNPDVKYCNWGAPGRGNHPINCVTYKQAAAYCAWKKMRLPTEAEWEYAARGKTGRQFPWGSQFPTCARAVFVGRRGAYCGPRGTRPVGSTRKGASAFGLMDMAGNVNEWMQDCYVPRFYKFCRNGCKDPIMPCRGVNDRRVIRGGGWRGYPANMKATRRGHMRETSGDSGVGFRCVSSKARPSFPYKVTGGK